MSEQKKPVKKTTELIKPEDIKDSEKKASLLRSFPFLRKPFRKVEKSELKSKEVYKELFPHDEIVFFHKLIAIHELQN